MRLKCGGFILALCVNHTISDGFGLFQFAYAVAEFDHGAEIPSVRPVWQRHLLNARDLPHAYMHHEYENILETSKTLIPLDNMTIQPPLPAGYYGNAIATPVAISIAINLCKQPLDFTLELAMKAKSKIIEDYIKSVADLMVIKGRPHFTVVRTYAVSDVTHVGSDNLDYGWGTPAYGGPTKSSVCLGLLTFHIPFKNNKGERGKLVPVCLPVNAMKVFVKELETMVKRDDDTDLGDAGKSSIFTGLTRL
ncbi:UNVERIFIED_CONTAM: Benzyl alcohol O-benzoyltransferase [Sesamum radiatum]|uniref:Benzyl alcohol O-benzoyltransferase n=1 Tax=Sesamum radiatum TaxID=300843 RepID=A0AAW2J1M5_SESRA